MWCVPEARLHRKEWHGWSNGQGAFRIRLIQLDIRCQCRTQIVFLDQQLITSGYICVPMPPQRLEELQLPPLVALSGSSEDPKGTAYHLTFDANNAKHPVSTGISAHDRSYAIRMVASGAGAEEFTRPGHLVTLRYASGGVVRRRGHTEATVGESMLLHCQFLHLMRTDALCDTKRWADDQTCVI